jgi:hypothetical protein
VLPGPASSLRAGRRSTCGTGTDPRVEVGEEPVRIPLPAGSPSAHCLPFSPPGPSDCERSHLRPCHDAHHCRLDLPDPDGLDSQTRPWDADRPHPVRTRPSRNRAQFPGDDSGPLRTPGRCRHRDRWRPLRRNRNRMGILDCHHRLLRRSQRPRPRARVSPSFTSFSAFAALRSTKGFALPFRGGRNHHRPSKREQLNCPNRFPHTYRSAATPHPGKPRSCRPGTVASGDATVPQPTALPEVY